MRMVCRYKGWVIVKRVAGVYELHRKGSATWDRLANSLEGAMGIIDEEIGRCN